MPLTKEFIQGTVFEEDFYELATTSKFDEKLQFLVADRRVNARGEKTIDVITFGMGYWQYGLKENDIGLGNAAIQPNSSLDYVDSELRQPRRHYRGVGPQLYNSPHALRGTEEDPYEFGAFLVTLQENRIADMRRPEDSTDTGFRAERLRYAGWLAMSKLRGLERAVDKVQEEQVNQLPQAARDQREPVEAAIYPQSPWNHELLEKREAELPPVPVSMMVIRSSRIFLRRIGNYTAR
jgi:hypothetical protein